MRDVYQDDLKPYDNPEPIRTLPGNLHKRPLLLGKDLDRKLQLYIQKVMEGNAVMSSISIEY